MRVVLRILVYAFMTRPVDDCLPRTTNTGRGLLDVRRNRQFVVFVSLFI